MEQVEDSKIHYIGDVDNYDIIFYVLVVFQRLKIVKFVGIENHIVFRTK